MTNNPYLQPQRIRAALNALGVRPSRDLGQNFLVDSAVLETIVTAGDIHPTDTVIEVGPGLGVLTHELVQRAGSVIAIEFDRRLAERLPGELPAPNLQVIQRDALQVAPGTLVGNGPYKVIANLPYQITSAILRHFLEAVPAPALMVVMVQWEVAERIVARPPNMSVLAHSVQVYAAPEIVLRVPAASFLPAPKVDSAILRLTRHTRPLVPQEEKDGLLRIVKAGFLHARKKLRNSLPSGLAAIGLPLDKETVNAALLAAAVDPDRRAETLTLAEWAGVYRRLKKNGMMRET